MQVQSVLKPVAILFSLLSIAACAPDDADLPALPPAPPLSQAYVLGPGDKLQILVFNVNALQPIDIGHGGNSVTAATGTTAGGGGTSTPDQNGPFTISDTGLVAAPVIGKVKAAGLTVEELEKEITAELAKYIRNPNVGVQIVTYRPFYILGEVKTPGSYPYVVNLNVRAAVAMAGGYTFRASKEFVIVERKLGGKVVRGRATPATPILPDDVITIPVRYF